MLWGFTNTHKTETKYRMVDLKLEIALGWKIKYLNCVCICINDTNFSIMYSIYPK